MVWLGARFRHPSVRALGWRAMSPAHLGVRKAAGAILLTALIMRPKRSTRSATSILESSTEASPLVLALASSGSKRDLRDSRPTRIEIRLVAPHGEEDPRHPPSQRDRRNLFPPPSGNAT